MLLERLWQRGLHWVTGILHNMKNHFMPMLATVLLRKRFIIAQPNHLLILFSIRTLGKCFVQQESAFLVQ
ncbi:MAG: hypothetical protein TE42_01120 [Candidatus Synechococcus spongiarum SP3]|uniref:Transposase DDE domain-containing protein n=1 Tax=Candidatus Synechococcus spongiarum SP3 TaxID=1604020 RepID=A0A0G2HNQ0_9SYNE|nr:MAG: hypothetical protein TE42_01120 [Candidatus Synechococcus spongiarum SP3]